METQVITENFRKLTYEEKVRLLQALWDEMSGETALNSVSESHRALLDERLREHEQNPGDVETWDKAKRDILADL